MLMDYWREKIGDRISTDQIQEHTWWTRLMKAPPERIGAVENLEKLQVVEDDLEWMHSFTNILMSSLEYSFVMLYILLFFLIDSFIIVNRPLVSIFIIFIIQKLLKNLRRTFGIKNVASIEIPFFSFLSEPCRQFDLNLFFLRGKDLNPEPHYERPHYHRAFPKHFD